MATILSFSAHAAAARRAAPDVGARAEIIVFPRTDICALRRWLEGGDVAADCPITGPGEKNPA